MNIVASTLIFVSIVNTALAGLVIVQRSKTEINRVFAASATTIAGWVLTNALFQMTDSAAAATFWANASYIFAIMTGASFLHFAWVYPRSLHNSFVSRKSLLWCAALICSVLMLIPDFAVRAVELETSRRIITNTGVYIVASFVASTILYALFIFYKTLRHLHGKERNQSRYVLLGAGILTFFGLTFNLLLPLLGEYSYVWLGPASSVIFVGFTVYSIVAHHLFDIRLIIQRAVVYTLLLGLLIAVLAVAVLLLTNVLQRVIGPAFLANPFVSSLIAALLIGFSVDPLRRWLMKVTDSFLFQQERKEQEILIQLSQRLSDVVLEEDVLDIVMKSIEQALRPRAKGLYLFDNGDENEPLNITYTKKTGEKSLIRMTKNELLALIDELQQSQTGSKVLDGGARAFLWLQKSHKSEASNEHSKAMLQGLLLLGPKRSGSSYTAEDDGLLEAIFTQAVSALHKAKLYQGDRQKTEFVSIAAHELLTPIAAAEGYLSLILDEHMGQVDKQADGYLRKVYSSTHRLHALVKDLLSVSRIEAGRTKFSPIEIDIEQLITDAIDQLQLVAQDNGLTLRIDKPREQLPLAFADPDKVTEVLINLIGNAIKYTPKGQVMISAAISHDKGKPQIIVSIADTGLGMTKKALEHLFEKFYRISTPETATIQGTGLGLYITKTIIEKMGGKIWVESNFGKGSTFLFTLPCSENTVPTQAMISS